MAMLIEKSKLYRRGWAAIKAVKAVVAVVVQMVAMDVQMGKIEKAFHRLAAEVTTVDKPPGRMR